jgi:hypothetical protein
MGKFVILAAIAVAAVLGYRYMHAQSSTPQAHATAFLSKINRMAEASGSNIHVTISCASRPTTPPAHYRQMLGQKLQFEQCTLTSNITGPSQACVGVNAFSPLGSTVDMGKDCLHPLRWRGSYPTALPAY